MRPCDCLVIEDAPVGVAAAAAAGIRVVAVPSMLKGGKPSAQYPQADPACSAGCVSLLPSLLDFLPEKYGLPPFQGGR